MVHLLGQNVTMARLRNLRFWAENGRVCMEDGKDNSYETMSVSEFLIRANAISDSLRASKKSDLKRYARERAELTDFLDAVVKVARLAREQGEPDDAAAVRAYQRARPKSIVVPNLVDMSAFR